MQRFGNLKVGSVFFIPKPQFKYDIKKKKSIFTQHLFPLVLKTTFFSHCIVSPCSENKTTSKHTDVIQRSSRHGHTPSPKISGEKWKPKINRFYKKKVDSVRFLTFRFGFLVKNRTGVITKKIDINNYYYIS